MRAPNGVYMPQMIGVWAMCLWHQMGQPEKVNLIELGPGRGTLLADLLRVCFLACSY
jgi:SAM-dependent MidA family methyltransferase